MEKGISLYPGLGMELGECLVRLEQAADLGLTRLFLSFHLPEADAGQFAAVMDPLLAAAGRRHLKTVGDLVPGRPIPQGLTHLRLDDGFSPEMAAALQREYPAKTLVLNASTVTRPLLQQLERAGVRMSRLEAMHNFYPRPHTGLSGAFVKKQNDLLHAFGIPVGAFLPSRAGRRGPLQEGLPTVEGDRELPLELGADRLLLLGTDFIQIGDDRPDAQELAALGQFSDALILLLRAEKITPLHARLMEHVYTTRADMAEEVIRMADSRAQWKACRPIPAWEAEPLPQGAVTLDNEQYGRYAGEVEICLRDLPADGRVDLLGRVAPEARFLLPLIGPGQKIQFRCEAGAQAGAR